MSYFNLFPKISYNVDDYNALRAVDITQSFKIKDAIKNFRGISYVPYVVEDGERPDNVSYRLYGTPSYDWIILLVNDIYNIYDEWPKSSASFEEYIIDKYGSISSAQATVQYYYDSKRNIIDSVTYASLPASQRTVETQYQYEVRKNLNKSRIRIVSKATVGNVQTALQAFLFKPIR